MEKPEYEIKAYVNTWPIGLKTAEEISLVIKGISAEKIVEYAIAGYCPHYIIDNGNPLFRIKETKEWLAENILIHKKGQPLPFNIQLYLQPDKSIEINPPKEISLIDELIEVNINHTPSGVYFLVSKNLIVYVGQSINVAARLAVHIKDKIFDKVYMIPIPRSKLDEVESAFIRYLRPIYNSIKHKGKTFAFPSGDKTKDQPIISKYIKNEIQSNQIK